MLLIDVMAGRTSDIIETLNGLSFIPPRNKKHKSDVKIRAYVVGAYYRKPPRRRVISIETLRKQRAAKAQADRLLKAHG